MNGSVESSSAFTGRPLGLLEKTFWNLNQERSVHFAVAAEVTGLPERSTWHRAVEAAVQRHPLLAASIRPDRHGALAFQPGDSRVSLQILGGSDWEAEVARQLATPVDSDHSPLLRVSVLDNGENAFLVLTFHHAAADGLSGVYVLRDILRSLAGESLVPYPVPAAQEHLLAWTPTNTPQPDVPLRPVQYRRSTATPPVVRGRQIDPAMALALRECCRREGVTVHAALTAAVLLSADRIAVGRLSTPVRVFSPISQRQRLRLADECVVALGAGVVTGGPTPRPAFWDLSRRVREELSPAQSTAGAQAFQDALGSLFASEPSPQAVAEFGAAMFAYEVLLTNLGAIPLESCYGPISVKAIWGPAVLLGYAGEQSIGAATTGGSLYLVHTSHEPVPGLLDAIGEALQAACGWQT